MRWIAIWGLVCFTTGCPSSEVPSKPADSERLVPKKARVALTAPLPGNVVPDFSYSAVDESNIEAQTEKLRKVTLEVSELSAEEALNSVAAQWVKAGFKAGERSAESPIGLVTQDFTSGDDTVRVSVVSKNYKPGSTGAKNDYKSVLFLTIKSK